MVVEVEDSEIVHSGFYGPGKSRSAAELAAAVPAVRAPSTARARVEAKRSSSKKSRKARAMPVGPTPERLAKGDVDIRVGQTRSVPPIERLRDQGKLSFDARENQALYEAALRLRRHFDGCLVGVQAQDLNRIIGAGRGDDDLMKEEAWVNNFDQFRTAVKLMGWSPDRPQRGAGRLVVAVICNDLPVVDAAKIHIGAGRTEAVMGAAMDRLREGLFALAIHWRLL